MNLPKDMDIPKLRRDTSNLDNVSWLLRNLFIRNSNHPEFNNVIEGLKKLLDKS